MSSFRRFSQTQRGFSLMEMLVVLAIFSILTLVVLVRNAQFNNTILIENLAYDVALIVREAQTYGISVREAPSGGDFSVGYGVYVRTDTPDRIQLFADVDSSKDWTTGDVVIEEITLRGGHEISSLCGYVTGGETNCTETIALSITFTRPNPEAHLERGNGTVWSRGEIHLTSPRGGERLIVVHNTGQISIEKPPSE